MGCRYGKPDPGGRNNQRTLLRTGGKSGSGLLSRLCGELSFQ
jgi:hypothetical protein